MSAVIIACKTIEKELLSAMDATRCNYPVLWLESGLHNWPDKLREHVQQLLDTCNGYDTVLLAMSFCGNAVEGLRTGTFSLVIPRCDDCISLLLGSEERRRQWPDAYFLTEGWLNSDLSLWAEYQKALDKYGEKRGKQIFFTMLRHYQHLALIDTGCFDAGNLSGSIEKIAKELDLTPVTLTGTLDYLKDLLTGPWPQERFLTIPANSCVILNCGRELTTGYDENGANRNIPSFI